MSLADMSLADISLADISLEGMSVADISVGADDLKPAPAAAGSIATDRATSRARIVRPMRIDRACESNKKVDREWGQVTISRGAGVPPPSMQ